MNNPGNATFPGHYVFPDLNGSITYSAYQAQTRDNDPSRQLLPAFRVLLNIVNRVFDGANLFRVLIGDLDVKSFFKSHDQLHSVEGVRAQIVYEGGVGSNFTFINSKLLDNDLFDLFFNGCWHGIQISFFFCCAADDSLLLHQLGIFLAMSIAGTLGTKTSIRRWVTIASTEIRFGHRQIRQSLSRKSLRFSASVDSRSAIFQCKR